MVGDVYGMDVFDGCGCPSGGDTAICVDVDAEIKNGLLHLKSIHPLWMNLEKCATGGVQICKCTRFLCDF